MKRRGNVFLARVHRMFRGSSCGSSAQWVQPVLPATATTTTPTELQERMQMRLGPEFQQEHKKLKVNHNKIPFDISIPHPELPFGGWLKFFKSQWFKLTKDPVLLKMVSACPIVLSHTPPTNSKVQEYKWVQQRLQQLTYILRSSFKKGQLSLQHVNQEIFVVMFFSVQRKMEKWGWSWIWKILMNLQKKIHSKLKHWKMFFH